jgi:hypothetical protein
MITVNGQLCRLAPPVALHNKPSKSVEEIRGYIRQECGKLLLRLDGASQWWRGDWWNAGIKWGEGKSTCEELGIEYQTAQNCGLVARTFQFSRRREHLSFTHYAILCGLDDAAVQDRFLDWCEESIETTGELRFCPATILAWVAT